MTVPRIDLCAYHINVVETDNGLVATVGDLPGCPAAAGRTATELESALEMTLVRYLDDHPEATAHLVDKPRTR